MSHNLHQKMNISYNFLNTNPKIIHTCNKLIVLLINRILRLMKNIRKKTKILYLKARFIIFNTRKKTKY